MIPRSAIALAAFACAFAPGARGRVLRTLGLAGGWIALTLGFPAFAQPGTPLLSAVCDFAPPALENLGEVARLHVADCDSLHRPGEPVLPFRTLTFVLPPGLEVAAVTAVTEPQEAMPALSRPIERATLPTPTPGQGAAATARLAPVDFLPGEGPDTVYPARTAELVSVQRQDGVDLAIVRVSPVRWQPGAARLEAYRRVRVDVSLAPRRPGAERPLQPPAGRSRREPRVGTLVNPEGLTGFAAASLPASGPTADYLLITRSNLAAAFQPLLDQKVQDGLAVRVLTVEGITNSHPGRDVAERIRNAIRSAYTNWGITYVLLGGDTATVPCRYAYAYMGTLADGTTVPSDLYYACLDGSWDHNGNGIFGEPTDGETGGEIDLLAEVYVGRAPVDSVAEVSLFVQKTLRYEQETHPHRTNVLFMAEYLGDTPTGPSQGWDMFVPLLPWFTNSYQIARLDDAPLTVPRWTGTDALAAMNTSPHLALFNGHGDTDTMMRLFTEDTDLLTNQWPFLAYSVGCNAGQFDNDKFSPDCIGEELIKRHARGAFAAVLNSRLGWYDPTNEWRWSGEFQMHFFRELLTNGHPRLGVANQLSKQALVSQVERSGLMTYRWCYFEITLFGDPHVAWQLPPAAPAARLLAIASAHEGVLPASGNHSFPVDSLVSCRVTNSPLADGPLRRFVCTGWTGSGSVPSAGSLPEVSFTLNTDSSLFWNWKTQVWFSGTASAGGSLSIPSGWQDAGETRSVTALATSYFHFVRWTQGAPAGAESNATLQILLDQPRELSALFAENVTSTGTPEWWLASQGWTNSFEAAARADADGDGMETWQEYVAGTSPRDPAARLQVRLISPPAPATGILLEWPSAAGRLYSVSRADSPSGPFVTLTNDLPAAPPVNAFTDPTAPVGPGARFYRVGVKLGP